MSLHFVGFKDTQAFFRAKRVFGPPDFIHRIWDVRALKEIAPGDTVVFFKGTSEDTPSEFAWDDSAQDIIRIEYEDKYV